MNFLRSISDAIIDRSPEELIGAMFSTLAVAIVAASFYRLWQRKSSPTPTFVGGLALVVGIVCMALVAGYEKYLETEGNPRASRDYATALGPNHGGPGQPPPWGFWSTGFHVLMAADENHDGQLTSEEVVRLVRKADADGDGDVNIQDIDRLMMSRFKPRTRPSARRHAGPKNIVLGAGIPAGGVPSKDEDPLPAEEGTTD